ncbi:hypothetical protein PS645_02629 [Pseudomonas fluorescens]|uniref:Uncharacterized protein n=1 Tax=Pseudomonas fluorescens TaxID=294 RepID=A0A5E6T4A5_PSEFL|nr:hypothetical protein PS645_02629 [Pseudomonas fluorescens]
MADRAGPTEQDRSEGMASLSEPPDVRGKSPWLLGAGPRRLFQVTRRKGETNSRPYRRNGMYTKKTYAPKTQPSLASQLLQGTEYTL